MAVPQQPETIESQLDAVERPLTREARVRGAMQRFWRLEIRRKRRLGVLRVGLWAALGILVFLLLWRWLSTGGPG